MAFSIEILRSKGTKKTTTVKEAHQKKLIKLSERQDRPLGKQDEGLVKSLDDVELTIGPKHPVSDKFNEIHFLADIDIFLSDLRNHEVPGEALFDIEAVTKAYAQREKKTPSDKGVENVRKYLKGNGLVVVPFDKGVGFCVMRKDTYQNKLSDLLDSNQLSVSR